MQHVRHVIRLVHQLMRVGRETGREIPFTDFLPVDVQLVDAHRRGVQLRLRDFAPKRQRLAEHHRHGRNLLFLEHIRAVGNPLALPRRIHASRLEGQAGSICFAAVRRDGKRRGCPA